MTWGGATWCAHPRLHTGESFSSWLHRSAQANGVADHSFCRQVLGERATWNRDLDRFANDVMLDAASRATGEEFERLRCSVIASASGRVFSAHSERGTLDWVLPLGMRGRKRKAFGQQYCPECLAADAPWLHLRWRFAWSIVCSIHGVALRDSCMACGSPISLHRLSSHPLRGFLCSHCGNRLAGKGEKATQREVLFQRRLERALAGHWLDWLGHHAQPLDVFTGLRSLARGIYTNSHGVGLVELMPHAMYRMRPVRNGRCFEHWRIDQRRYAMSVLRHILVDWPERFIDLAKAHCIYRARFDNCARSPQPAWLELALLPLERSIPNLRRRWAARRMDVEL
ncbi:TniQ family protein [Xanthomonas sp. NCPPB 1062]|uniref:TniQ family protein n=1 Tax=Xanthomonas sp. NCPPB 1062 TaxID=487523 RepID=UPI003557B8B2